MKHSGSILPDTAAMKGWRHRLHQNPELGFEEQATSRLVADLLAAWGYEVHTGIAETGLVGVLRLGTGEGPQLGLRAEMDALPIHEETGLPWASRIEGKMHACGHDGHTAILLGAADAIARAYRSGDLPGDGVLNLIFQPAEELGGGGGARRMIEEGLFERFPCDAIFALHNYPGRAAGHLYFRGGPMMASSDRATLRFLGKGGHGALPHMAIDPTPALAATVTALQSIVGRNVDPLQSVVISIGQISAGRDGAYNIIPESAELTLNVRAFCPEVRDLVERRIEQLARSQAAAFDCRLELEYERGYPVLINDRRETERLVGVAEELFGSERVVNGADPIPASEDFAFMLQQVPGSYLMIGNGDNGYFAGHHCGPCSVHNPKYDFNDDCLAVGAQLWLGLVRQFFA